jgi:hypothetical protein
VKLIPGALTTAGLIPTAKPAIDLSAMRIGFLDQNEFLQLSRIFEDIGLIRQSILSCGAGAKAGPQL